MTVSSPLRRPPDIALLSSKNGVEKASSSGDDIHSNINAPHSCAVNDEYEEDSPASSRYLNAWDISSLSNVKAASSIISAAELRRRHVYNVFMRSAESPLRASASSGDVEIFAIRETISRDSSSGIPVTLVSSKLIDDVDLSADSGNPWSVSYIFSQCLE